MSFEALAWAGKCKTANAADKLVLFGLADRHNSEANGAYPSTAWLVEFTSLNRKTVIAALDRLEASGFISDSGERRGQTGQVKLYRLHLDARVGDEYREKHYVYRLTDEATGEFYVGVRSCVGDVDADNYSGSGRWPTGAAFRGNKLRKEVIATFDSRVSAETFEAKAIEEAMQEPLCKNIAKGSRKRDSFERVPILAKAPTFSSKGSQKRDTEPVRTGLPSEGKPSSGKRARVSVDRAKHEIPEDWQPLSFGDGTQCGRIIAGWPPDELEYQLEHFRAHHGKKGDKFKDWQKAWATWVLNKRSFGSGRMAGNLRQGQREHPGLALLREAEAELAAEAEREAQSRH